jgi:hypothetical protein
MELKEVRLLSGHERWVDPRNGVLVRTILSAFLSTAQVAGPAQVGGGTSTGGCPGGRCCRAACVLRPLLLWRLWRQRVKLWLLWRR